MHLRQSRIETLISEPVANNDFKFSIRQGRTHLLRRLHAENSKIFLLFPPIIESGTWNSEWVIVESFCIGRREIRVREYNGSLS